MLSCPGCGGPHQLESSRRRGAACAAPRLMELSSSNQRNFGVQHKAGLESSSKQGASSRNVGGGVLRGFNKASLITEREIFFWGGPKGVCMVSETWKSWKLQGKNRRAEEQDSPSSWLWQMIKLFSYAFPSVRCCRKDYWKSFIFFARQSKGSKPFWFWFGFFCGFFFMC